MTAHMQFITNTSNKLVQIMFQNSITCKSKYTISTHSSAKLVLRQNYDVGPTVDSINSLPP